MTYTLWMNDEKIGETDFEMPTRGSRRAGLFRPTAFGLTVLPGITDMFPALIAFGELCRRENINVDDDRPESASIALDAFGGTAEGQRVIAAAKHIGAIVVRDATGGTVFWDSLAISDLELLASLARKQKPGKRTMMASVPGSGSYIVSLTLLARAERGLAQTKHFGAKRREPAPH
jgi:hypothetical protein